MEIAFIITGGVVLMTALAAGLDFLSKRRKGVDNQTRSKVEALEKKLHDLEQAVNEKDNRIAQLESDFSFLNRLLEKK